MVSAILPLSHLMWVKSVEKMDKGVEFAEFALIFSAA